MEEKLAWSFKLFDLDEDGYISKAEMLAIVDAIYRMVGHAQELPDDEATATLRVEKVFRLMDLVKLITFYLIFIYRIMMGFYRSKNSWKAQKQI
jgi:Ca2+-binding EF-hand superfamily protein